MDVAWRGFVLLLSLVVFIDVVSRVVRPRHRDGYRNAELMEFDAKVLLPLALLALVAPCLHDLLDAIGGQL